MATQIYKTTKAEVLDAASGKTIVTEPVVIFNGEGESKTAGPAAKSYERARTAAGGGSLEPIQYSMHSG